MGEKRGEAWLVGCVHPTHAGGLTGQLRVHLFLKRKTGSWLWWLTPIIPDTQEAEIRKIMV
jgi:hypothetical protein